MVVIDLSAAFNTVDHTILLDVLKCKFDIKDKALKWFNSYLRPRSFKVVIGDSYSKNINLTVSVLQGGYAGVNIFNLYCSSLQETIPPSLSISGFTDDHSISDTYKAPDINAEISTTQCIVDCMPKIKHWMDQMPLKMNPSKTEFIYFGFYKYRNAL